MTFGTDVIVGFPGESDDQAEETVTLVREAGFTQVFAFTYSPRPGTAAERFADDVPAPVKAERLRRVQAAADALADERRRSLVGAVVEVLVEGPSDRGGGTFQGRTRNNDVVHVEGLEAAGAAGSIVEVLVAEARPHCLAGAVRRTGPEEEDR
jgi:tRNA-2-methylthio-N6-dimethylallyladenosine synthase